MIKKLKKKFILINMVLAALVLNISFVIIGISTYQRLSSESLKALESSFTRNSLVVPGDEGINPQENNLSNAPPNNFPAYMDAFIFNVKLSADKNNMTLIGNNIVFDQDTISKLVDLCQNQNKDTGIIMSYKLRYMVRFSNAGTEIAFYDLTNDIHIMVSLIKNFLIAEVGGLIAFFSISLFLANWALKPLELSLAQQKQFIADASHELKTPLTVILANADILASHKSDTIEQQYKWLSYIQAEGNHMRRLINDLLFLANADALRETPEFTKVNLSDLVWNCYLPFESIIFEQGKLIDNTIHPDVYIYGDEGKLKQLIMILLDNACKYTDKKGKIIVSLLQKQDKVYFSVNNEGVPISSEHLPHLFERFYRADESRTRETGGYGLGLSIAKAITDMLHGKISVISTKEAGTTFTVLFASYKINI